MLKLDLVTNLSLGCGDLGGVEAGLHNAVIPFGIDIGQNCFLYSPVVAQRN
jgi:hypothetical protein